jgi:hypothetical protein
MQSANLQQYHSGTKFLALFNLNTGSTAQSMKILYIITAVIALIYMLLFTIGLCELIAAWDPSLQAILGLILCISHFPVYIYGMAVTVNALNATTAYGMLIVMQILFLIDLILALIVLGEVSYVLVAYYYYDRSEWVFFCLLFVSHIIPVTIATISYFLYFKKSVTGLNSYLPIDNSVANAYIPPASVSPTNLYVPDRIALQYPNDIAFAQGAQGAVLNGIILPSGIAIPAQRDGKNWTLIGNEIVLI